MWDLKDDFEFAQFRSCWPPLLETLLAWLKSESAGQVEN
jgi:hypothetical protein